MVAALAFAAVASAQPKAVGVRVGNGAEVSYQHYLGGSNFIEADLGFMSNGFRLTGIYDFDLGSAGNFNFYVGPGASLGFVNGTDGNGNAKTYFSAAVVGQVGAEFAVPGRLRPRHQVQVLVLSHAIQEAASVPRCSLFMFSVQLRLQLRLQFRIQSVVRCS